MCGRSGAGRELREGSGGFCGRGAALGLRSGRLGAFGGEGEEEVGDARVLGGEDGC